MTGNYGLGRYFISNAKDHSIKLWDLRGKRASLSAAERSTHNSTRDEHYDYRFARPLDCFRCSQRIRVLPGYVVPASCASAAVGKCCRIVVAAPA